MRGVIKQQFLATYTELTWTGLQNPWILSRSPATYKRLILPRLFIKHSHTPRTLPSWSWALQFKLMCLQSSAPQLCCSWPMARTDAHFKCYRHQKIAIKVSKEAKEWEKKCGPLSPSLQPTISKQAPAQRIMTKCPECEDSEMFEDIQDGNLVCRECGLCERLLFYEDSTGLTLTGRVAPLCRSLSTTLAGISRLVEEV